MLQGEYGRSRDGSQLSKVPSGDLEPSLSDVEDRSRREPSQRYGATNGAIQPALDASTGSRRFSSSSNQKTPARSYFQSSFQESHGQHLGAARYLCILMTKQSPKTRITTPHGVFEKTPRNWLLGRSQISNTTRHLRVHNMVHPLRPRMKFSTTIRVKESRVTRCGQPQLRRYRSQHRQALRVRRPERRKDLL